MIDISIFLSTTSHLISRKLMLISRITTNPIRFFSQIRRAIVFIYNMAVYTQGTYRNTVYTMVCCIPVTVVTSNDGEGGRKILGLSTAWTVYQRAAKGIEVGLIGTHKVSRIYLMALSSAEMISAVHVGSLGFECSFASRSATNEENISIHYYQIRRNWRGD